MFVYFLQCIFIVGVHHTRYTIHGHLHVYLYLQFGLCTLPHFFPLLYNIDI